MVAGPGGVRGRYSLIVTNISLPRSGQRVRENAWLPHRGAEGKIGRRTCAAPTHSLSLWWRCRRCNWCSQRQDTPSRSHHWQNVFSQPCRGCGLQLRPKHFFRLKRSCCMARLYMPLNHYYIYYCSYFNSCNNLVYG